MNSNSSLAAIVSRNKQRLCLMLLVLASLLAIIAGGIASRDKLLAARQQFDRANLVQLFAGSGFDNDLVLDTYLIPATASHARLVNVQLLGLQRDRLAYLAKQGGEVVAIAIPASADDGFNGTVDLLVAINMFGRVTGARVIEDVTTTQLYGIVDVIESKWMRRFTGNAMRDIRRVSWEKITPENEYDQFVGASITPKAVAERIYNAMVFFQSNRIELMRGGS